MNLKYAHVWKFEWEFKAHYIENTEHLYDMLWYFWCVFLLLAIWSTSWSWKQTYNASMTYLSKSIEHQRSAF